MFLGPGVFDKLEREVLTQRVPFPVWRQKEPSQIRVIAKTNTKKIKHFAFQPIRCRPYSCHTRHTGFIGSRNFQTNPFVSRNREKIIDDLKWCLIVWIVDTSKIREIIKRSFLVTFEEVANINDALPIYSDRELPNEFDGVANRFAKLRLKLFH